MENQPMNQGTDQAVNPPMEQTSSNTMWYIIIALIVATVAGCSFWYYTAQAPSVDTQTSSMGVDVLQTQDAPLSAGNSITDILADLNQTLDGSAELSQAAAASASDVQGF